MRDPRPRVARVTRPERALGQGARCARKASWCKYKFLSKDPSTSWSYDARMHACNS